MADPRTPPPVLLVTAIFSRHSTGLEAARTLLAQEYGTISLVGDPFVFDQTRYYEPSMGSSLLKQLLAFRDLVAPDRLPDVKLRTNRLEQELAVRGDWPDQRPVNIDPGYLDLAKFVLATTKDQSHRLYLRDGIFAEVTLHFQAGAWLAWPWTYADYRLPGVAEFLLRARAFYREQLRHRP